MSVSSDSIIRIAAVARCIACSLRLRALRFRPSVFLTMTCLQGCDDVDEACSFSRVHFALSHPSVRVRLGDYPLGLVQFGAMHFEKRGIRPEVRKVEAGVRVWTRTSHDWYRAVAVRQSLSQDAASQPLQVGVSLTPSSVTTLPETSISVAPALAGCKVIIYQHLDTTLTLMIAGHRVGH